MQSDTTQDKTIPALKNLKPSKPAIRKGGKWLGDADEIFDYLENRDREYELEKDGWWRTMSAALALLKHAHHMIERHEDRIEELKDLATTDELTGLMNRRGFFESFLRELDRAKRGQSQGGLLVMIDLDNFKAINDTYGHPAGDAALRALARTLASDIRMMDVAARLGGDEFVLLLTNTTRKDALERAQRLIKALNSLSIVWYGAEIPIRASLGLKEYESGDTAERIFTAADVQLYASKQLNKGVA